MEEVKPVPEAEPRKKEPPPGTSPPEASPRQEPRKDDIPWYRYLIRYGALSTLDWFYSRDAALCRYESCIILSDRGMEWGTIISSVTTAGPERKPGQHEIVRRATEEDRRRQRMLEEELSVQAYDYCHRKISEMKLPMKLVLVERLFGGGKIIFYFLADGRVDFRELVRELAREYKTRIEMKQVGVRDESRMLADYEHCGQELCCRRFLRGMDPVTMKMAKNQKTTLDPGKISGHCGRLMCCLRYEDETYTALRKNLPPRNSWVRCQDKWWEVVNHDLLRQQIVALPEGGNEPERFRVGDLQEVQARRPAAMGEVAAPGEKTWNRMLVRTPFFLADDRTTWQHLYWALLADVLKRVHRLRGREVFVFLGAEEQGRAVTERVAREGQAEKACLDGWAADLGRLLEKFRVQPDILARTRDPGLVSAIQEWFERGRERSLIYERTLALWRCQGDAEHAYQESDVSETAGAQLTCPDCGGPVARGEFRYYFFALSRYGEELKKLFDQGQLEVEPRWARDQVKAWLGEKLADIAITRPRFSSGIPVPGETGLCFKGPVADWWAARRFVPVGYQPDLEINLLPSDREKLLFATLVGTTWDWEAGRRWRHRYQVGGIWQGEGPPLGEVDAVGQESWIRYGLLTGKPLSREAEWKEEEWRANAGAWANRLDRVLAVLRRIPALSAGVVPPAGGNLTIAAEDQAAFLSLVTRGLADLSGLKCGAAMESAWEAMEMLAGWGERAGEKAALGDGYLLLEGVRMLSILLFPVLPSISRTLKEMVGLNQHDVKALSQLEWGLLPPGRKLVPVSIFGAEPGERG